MKTGDIMRIEQFLYLKKIAETQSINIACKSLFITQQALSRSIISLEEELGVQLLNRNKHGVSLTIQGEYVLKEGNKILELADNIRNHFLSEKILPDTTLRIATTPLNNQFLLSTALTYFYKNFPSIKINVNTMPINDIVGHLLEEQHDIGFITEISFENQSNLMLPYNLKYVPVFSSPVSILMSHNSSLNQKKTISLEDLRNKKILFLKNSICQDDLLRIFFTEETMPEVITVDNELLLFKLLADDIGISFFVTVDDLDINARIHPDVTVRSLSEKANLSLGYVVNEEKYNENIFAQIFCEHLL